MIDLHAHFLPDAYRAELLRCGHEHPDGFPVLPEWSAGAHLAAMDRLGIGTAVLSVSSPGVDLGGEVPATDLARYVNDEGRRAVVDHPGRFGQFASLPLPAVDASLAEIARCCDRLDVAGFVMLTNVGGRYLGHPELAPIFAELDRRGARVLLHPTSPVCWQHTSLDRPRPMLEFIFDTARAVVDLVLSGTVARHRGISFVVPHAGGVLPMVVDRIDTFTAMGVAAPGVDVLRDVAGLHFDLAGSPTRRQFEALLTLTTIEHLHFGSDYPFTPERAVATAIDRFAGAGGVVAEVLAVLRSNTERLFPALGVGTTPTRESTP